MRLPPLIFLALSTVLGAMSLWLFKHLPSIASNNWLIVMGSMIFLLCLIHRNKAVQQLTPRVHQAMFFTHQLGILFLFFIFGFFLCLHATQKVIAERIPEACVGVPLMIKGKIISLPEVQARSTHFDFLIEQYEPLDPIKEHIIWPVPKKIHLSWYLASQVLNPKLMIGDTWCLTVRLKSPRSTFNPASFDYEAWLFAHRITAIGSVINNADNRRLSSCVFNNFLDRWREKILTAIQNTLADNVNLGVVEALSLGVRDQLTANEWQMMEATGTNHLLAIAGLHIGFVLAMVYVVSKFIWRRITWLTLYCPASEAALFIAWLAAIYYSLLSGLALPAERAFAMLSIALLASLLRRYIPPWHALAVGLFAVFIYDPLTIFSESFYLSFVTVAVIIFSQSGHAAKAHWRQLFSIQWVITLGLVPVTLYFFHQISLMNIVANMIAIPWIAWGVLPFILLGIFFLPFSQTVSQLLWHLSAKILTGYWPMLGFFAHFQRLEWHAIPSFCAMIFAMIGVMILLLPKGFPCRVLGVFGFLPLIFSTPPIISTNTFLIKELDVGQGLSVMIQTAHHTLVFDTGARLDDHYDMGQSVVVPALLASQIHMLDMLVISHGDNDHSGGSGAVLRSLPVTHLLTSVPNLYADLPGTCLAKQNQSLLPHFFSWLSHCLAPPKIAVCQAGQSWRWDGVAFLMLGPISYQSDHLTHSSNNLSCVLKISNAFHSILLTGDIEKSAEHELVKTYQNQIDILHSEIIVAPHHGSKTSSSAAFLSAVHPSFVFYATGYRNRFHFPNDLTIARYQSIHARSMNTAEDGQIIAFMPNQACCISLVQARKVAQHFWSFQE